MSNRLDDLDPEVQDMALRFLAACEREGIKLKVTHTLRTYAEQEALYAQGRTTPGSRVTSAPAGYSWHNFGRAFDVAEKDATPYDLGAPGLHDDNVLWEQIGSIGESFGLEWGGRWKWPDRPHFQFTGGLTLARARQHHEDQQRLAWEGGPVRGSQTDGRT